MRARVLREGTDVTLVTFGGLVQMALDAAAAAEDEGVSIEVIDLRSLSPIDYDTVTASVRTTGRVVIAHEGPREAGLASEIAAVVTERCFHFLEASPVRVTGHDVPVPAGEAREAPPARPGPHPRRRRPGARASRRDARPASGRSRCMLKEFRLPDLGEGLTESEIVSWRVAAGDHVTLNQIIADVETAKAVVELPSPFDGIVQALHAEAGDTVEVGERIVTFELEGDAASRPRWSRVTRWSR